MIKLLNSFINRIGIDKVLHFLVSFSLTLIGGLFEFPGIIISSILTLIIGIVKEFLDDVFSWGDLYADGLGIGLGIFIWYISTLF